VFPPWREIYAHDGERKQDFQEAIETFDVIVKALPEFGYRAVEVPRVSVEGRIQFILQHITSPSPPSGGEGAEFF
jgi:predicted ATPase